MSEPASSEPPLLVVIPDTNVLIHGKALSDLPWNELGRPSVEVLFVPPTIRELDKLKVETGRPNKIARDLSSEIRALLKIPGHRAQVRKAAPVVTKRVELRKVTESKHPGLKLDHGDQALINYALHLKEDGFDVILLTNDTICGTTSEEFGLPTQYLPDHWLREPEPDQSAKEIAKLKAENLRLVSAEPEVALSFRREGGQPLEKLEATVARWPELNKEQIDHLMSEVERQCPAATSFERPVTPSNVTVLGSLDPTTLAANPLSILRPRSVYEPPTEEEIARYREHTFPEWVDSIRAALSTLHEELAKRIEWPSVVAVASNRGTRPANDVLLQLKASGAFAISDHDKGISEPSPLSKLAYPPKPPQGHYRIIDPLGLHPGPVASLSHNLNSTFPDILASRLPPTRQPDAFYWRTDRRNWVNLLELECRSWRHNQNDVIFHLTAHPNRPTEVSGVIELSVHAANLSETAIARLPVQISWLDGSTMDKARNLVEELIQATQIRFRF